MKKQYLNAKAAKHAGVPEGDYPIPDNTPVGSADVNHPPIKATQLDPFDDGLVEGLLIDALKGVSDALSPSLEWRTFSGPQGFSGVLYRAQAWTNAGYPKAFQGKSYTILAPLGLPMALAFCSPPYIKRIGMFDTLHDAKRSAEGHFRTTFL